MPNTDSLETVTLGVVNLLRNNAGTLGLNTTQTNKDVAFGDQQKIPRTPYITVEPGPKTRELTGIGGKGRTDIDFTVFILAYISGIKSVEINAQDAIHKAEQIELIMHSDVTIGGLVIHGFCTAIEPGYTTRSGELMRTVRVTWQGKSKLLIA